MSWEDLVLEAESSHICCWQWKSCTAGRRATSGNILGTSLDMPVRCRRKQQLLSGAQVD